jgi:hypothetical protein
LNDTDAVIGVALLVALIGVASALVTAVLTIRWQRKERQHERVERHRERLRNIYSDVMLAALRIIPEEFNMRLGSGKATTKEEIDVLGARLRLERWHEGDHILEALQEVWHASNEWNKHAAEGRVGGAYDPPHRRVMDSMDALEDEMRAALGIPEAAPGSTLGRVRNRRRAGN